jgi:hypothetical protein
MPDIPTFEPPNLGPFEFLPRPPLIQSNPYENEPELNGFPGHSSKLLWALDRCLIDFAKELYQVDSDHYMCRASPFSIQTPETVCCHLTNIFFTTSVQFIRLALKQQLYTCFRATNDKSLRLPNEIKSVNQSKEKPEVYSLVHCKANGTTPSKSEYIRVLDRMEEYNTTYFTTPTEWARADQNAAEIDSASPEIEGRKWKGATTGCRADKWMTGKHPRRYSSHSEHSEKEICRFIENFRERQAGIDDKKADEPIPWSIAYVGWARTLDSRRDQHFTHSGLSSAIA